MKQLNASIPSKLEAAFREHVGSRKGDLGRAVTAAIELWLQARGVATEDSPVWTSTERAAADTLVAWLRDPDPKEKINRDVLLMALRSYQERHPELMRGAAADKPTRRRAG